MFFRRRGGDAGTPEQEDAAFLQELDELEKEIRPGPDSPVQRIMLAYFRAIVKLRDTPEGRAIAFLFDPENKNQLDLIRTPTGRNAYRQKLANLLEEGSDEEARRLVRGVPWFGQMTPKEQGLVLRRPKQRELAAKIRSEMEPDGGGVPRMAERDEQGSSLTEEEQVRASRALRLVFHNFDSLDAERYKKARAEEDWETLMELAVRIHFAGALALIPVPPGEPYGRVNRSPMLLDTDRKPCEVCGAPIPNTAHLCPKHSKAEARARDALKKKRRYETLALARDEARAAPGSRGVAVAADGTRSGEMDPGPDFRTLRRRLMNR